MKRDDQDSERTPLEADAGPAEGGAGTRPAASTPAEAGEEATAVQPPPEAGEEATAVQPPLEAGEEATAVQPPPEAGEEATAVETPAESAGEQTAVTAVTPADEPEEPTVVTGAAAGPGAEAAGSLAAAVKARRLARLHGALVVTLVVLSCLLFVLSGVAIWAHYTVLNTDGYLGVVGPIAKNPATLQALSDYVAEEVIAATDLEARTSGALPPRLSFLAAPITGAVNDFIAKETYAVVSSPKAYDLWMEINRVAHESIVALLRGEATYAYIEGNEVKLNTLPLISEVLVRIDAKLPDGLSTRFNPPVISPETPPSEAAQQISDWLGRPLKEGAGQVTLLTSDSLGPAQTAVKWFDRLIYILPVLTLAAMAAAIWLSKRRRRTVIELGIGIAASLIILRVLITRLSDALVARLETAEVVPLVQDVVSASVGPLRDVTIWIVVAAIVVAIGAWLTGRKDLTGAVVSAGSGAVRASAPLLTWSTAHADVLRIVGLAVGLLLVLLFSWSWLWFVIWLILIGAFQLLVSWLAGGWPFAHGERSEAGAE